MHKLNFLKIFLGKNIQRQQILTQGKKQRNNIFKCDIKKKIISGKIVSKQALICVTHTKKLSQINQKYKDL